MLEAHQTPKTSYASEADASAFPFFFLPSSPFSSPKTSVCFLTVQLFVQMPCTPPYHAGPGHTDRSSHDKASGCAYYAVATGRVRGVFTNSWIAREQTDCYVDFSMKSFKTWAEMEFWWGLRCKELHANGCPPVEPVTFSLSPHPAHQPGPPPCTCHFPHAGPATIPHYFSTALSIVPVAPAAGPSSLGVQRIYPTAAPSPFNSPSASSASINSRVIPISLSTSSTTSSLSSESLLSASSTSTSSAGPFKKEESLELDPSSSPPQLRITHATRIQLMPTGRAYAEHLNAHEVPVCASLTPAHGDPSNTPTRHAVPTRPAAAAPMRALPSVLVTPAANHVLPVAAPELELDDGERLYGIRGVGVFYPSLAAAWRMAHRLGLLVSRIMVSSNVEKLEAWMTNQPFNGED
ncbi:hypothetical protein B0H16DRAFT_1715329 [Mycena metata]|uniref:Ribonuclease H1 N-terminal domain-containing protein n=1 Tax=Mycena metata TaxID=1033252 RepID=A0AAD7JSF4_9AGAR|nr:hypothetical protein B0H16DRAFT_1715329 [Mycena metata]